MRRARSAYERSHFRQRVIRDCRWLCCAVAFGAICTWVPTLHRQDGTLCMIGGAGLALSTAFAPRAIRKAEGDEAI